LHDPTFRKRRPSPPAGNGGRAHPVSGRPPRGSTAPGLLDRIDASINHLGDPAKDGTGDDNAVRDIARRFVASARKG